MPSRRPTSPWLLVAAALGTAHALASLAWAAGSPVLASTLGEWARSWRAESPVAAGLALATIGLGKLAAAWVPVLAARRGGPRHGLRLVAWLVAGALVAYGVANVVAANLALTGALGPVEDLAAVRGHAWLWDPLFLAWGLALGAGLRGARRRRPAPEGTDRRRGVPELSRG
ncbi:DUF3995 domain-containing protein [Arthrobacter sp. NEB 688]|uniref:DUF3995 domain-containing protein n=1 Tax=Arthrobacter sp. NEB 688 TaxID=904039 RepID=UPI001566E379|nr:DUF3995 domain-containing protein [Arthrobacter sp. NEB 688]QKE84180.1 DUF3995 domain-containing protein [Arthrobacter sp. NEB 688]